MASEQSTDGAAVHIVINLAFVFITFGIIASLGGHHLSGELVLIGFSLIAVLVAGVFVFGAIDWMIQRWNNAE